MEKNVYSAWNNNNEEGTYPLSAPEKEGKKSRVLYRMHELISQIIEGDIISHQDKDLPKMVDLDYAFNYIPRLNEKYHFPSREVMSMMRTTFLSLRNNYDACNKSQIEDIFYKFKTCYEKLTGVQK